MVMNPTPQSDDLRETITGMLVEVGISAEELYEMLFGRGQDVDVSMPELDLTTDQMMSEGTWASQKLSDKNMDTVALHVDIRSALNALDGAGPEAAEALTALLGEDVSVGSNELQVKRKFFEFKKGLKAFLAALSFMQLLKVAVALAEKAAPNLVPTFMEMKNRPQERKQLEQFVLTQVSEPTPPAMAALALAGLSIAAPGQGFEFAQPFKQFAIGLDMPQLEQVRARLETIVEREPQKFTSISQDSDSADRSHKDKDKNKDGIPDRLQTKQQVRSGNPSQQQQQNQPEQQQQQQQEGATPPGPERKPKMSNMYGRSKSGSGRKAREAAEKEAKEKEQTKTVAIEEEDRPQSKSTGSSASKVEALMAQRAAEAAQRNTQRESNAKPQPAAQPEGQSIPPVRSSKSSSGSKSEKSSSKSSKEQPAPAVEAAKEAVKEAAKETAQLNPGKMPEPTPIAEVKVTAPPLEVKPNAKMMDLLPADMLKGFSGLKAQEANIEDLGQTKSSIAKDDKLVSKAKPTPQIER